MCIFVHTMVNWKEVNKKITNDRMNYYTWWERQIEDRLGITITQAAVRAEKECVGALIAGQRKCAMQWVVCYRQINCPLPEGLALKSLGLMNIITDGCKQWHYKEDNSVRMWQWIRLILGDLAIRNTCDFTLQSKNMYIICTAT